MINKIGINTVAQVYPYKNYAKNKKKEEFRNNTQISNLVFYQNLPKINFRGQTYLPSQDFEELTKENIDKVLPLYRGYQEGMNQVVDEDKLKKFINTVLDDNHKIILIEEGGAPQGFIHFSTSYSTIDMTPFTTIQGVYVKPEARGRRLARRLVEECQRWTKENNYKGIFVKTHAKNSASMGMYTSMNFHNEREKYGIFFWSNDDILDYTRGYVNTKK